MAGRRTFSYGPHERHKLDLYCPEGERAMAEAAQMRPPVCLVFLHGGAWRSGDKSEYEALGRFFAERGFLVAIPNYRLSTEPGALHPDHVEDARRAIRHIGYRHIVVIGHSAGAHMAAWLAGESHDFIGGFVGLQGIYDIPSLISEWPTYREWFIEAAFGGEECWAAASPTRRPVVSRAPWLVVHASGDELVDGGQSSLWLDTLHKSGVPAEVFDPGDVSHFDVVHNLATPGDSTAEAIIRFAKGLSCPR